MRSFGGFLEANIYTDKTNEALKKIITEMEQKSHDFHKKYQEVRD